jgi:uncharacterized membrane protein
VTNPPLLAIARPAPLIAILFVCVSVILPRSAQAELMVCNDTEDRRNLAIAYKEGDHWFSKGWWLIDPGKCKTVVKGKLKQRYFYYRATTRKGDFRGDGYLFCTQKKPFVIKGQKPCKSRGYRQEPFRKLDSGKTSPAFTLNLNSTTIGRQDPAPPGKSTPAPSRPSSKSAPAPATPGQYGEPLSIQAIFKGCDRIDGLLACNFIADGWNYVAMDDNRTPSALMKRMDALPLNQGVSIAGDLVSQGDVNVDITVRSLEVIPASNGHGLLRNSLIGAWRSKDDPRSSIRFGEDGRRFDYYDGNLTAKGRFRFSDRCPDGSSPDGIKVLVVTADNDPDPLCYGLGEVTLDRLELFYLGRGNLLEYVRSGN